MEFNGFLKLTLLDFPEKTACTLFTRGCNFRCPFCHNASLALSREPMERFDEEEVLAYLQKRRGILDGVCITGGEPLLQAGLSAFMRRVKELGYAVKLDTNGSKPAALKQLVAEGLVDYVAMDIKNTPEKYPQSVGIDGYDVAPILDSVAFLMSGAVPYEFRTTVTAELHTVEDIEAIAKWLQGAPRYFLQNFEDSGDLIGEQHAVSRETLHAMKAAAAPYIPSVALRGVSD
ncbi:MAG: anaerobic ribonucleoside-triphosphate reductase activating protein [Clostridia bacterium]|nr:anaerobic ribonucleoside-triphosphate reductase activating protein [Clostridia bacterium]